MNGSKFAVAELAEGVVTVTQGRPALMFGDEAVLQVVENTYIYC